MRHGELNIFGRTVADLALIATCSIPLLFLSLGGLPILLWDESRMANNALEMSQNGFSLVTTFLGHPDLWNTKPPLLIWLQSLSFKIFGPSEWALRLPSALAALATSWLVYWFCRRVTASRATGIAGALVLLTTSAYVAPHVARTGDYDALLVFFTTAIFTCCYFLFEDVRAGARASNTVLVGISLALTGAIMTKGVAGLLILPGIALMSLPRRALLRLLGDWRVWLAACLPFAIAGIFYFARESASAGYLEAVWANELSGRFAVALEGHREPAIFYVRGLVLPGTRVMNGLNLGSAVPWSWMALALLPFGVRHARFTPAQIYLTVVMTVFLIIVSSAQTRMYWYVAPAYPLIACLVTISGFAVLQHTLSIRQVPHPPPSVIMLGLFALLSAIVGSQIVERNRKAIKDAHIDLSFQSVAFLREIQPILKPRDALRIVREREEVASLASPRHVIYSPQEAFYAALLRTHGIDATVVTPDYQPRPADLLMWCDPIPPDVWQPALKPLAFQGPCHLARWTGTNALAMTQ